MEIGGARVSSERIVDSGSEPRGRAALQVVLTQEEHVDNGITDIFGKADEVTCQCFSEELERKRNKKFGVHKPNGDWLIDLLHN